MPGIRVDSEPITITAAYQVEQGREAEFRACLLIMLEELSATPGYLGGGVLAAGSAGAEWHVIYRFDSERSAQAWEDSFARIRWSAHAESFSKKSGVQRASGIQNWFEGPVRMMPPPPKWKLWFVNLSAVFPPVLIFNLTVIPYLGGLNPLIRTLVLCLGVTAMVTWVLMPRLQRLLKQWLYPPLQSLRGRHRRSAAGGAPRRK